jgi:hypothetical protein
VGDYVNGGVEELRGMLRCELQGQAEKYGIELIDVNIANQFKYLIRKVSEKAGERAAVIVDEYDAPLLETISNSTVHEEARAILKGFYSALKSSDRYLRFLFLTGVTKFAKVSVFSELNHLIDMTLDPRYADICGITQEELEHNFRPEIDAVLENTGRSREEYMDNLRNYYNGYRFSEKPLKVYNPFGLLNHFDQSGKFEPYWYETSTPSFLIKLITDQRINILSDGRIDTLVETKKFVYCFEFKINKTANEALAQIDTKEYMLPWTGSGKKLFKVGVNFDSEKRNIGDWKYTTAP